MPVGFNARLESAEDFFAKLWCLETPSFVCGRRVLRG
jgi:hypothetical protein